jgi:hypothetical protein
MSDTVVYQIKVIVFAWGVYNNLGRFPLLLVLEARI